MNRNGWISLHRQILDNPLARKPNYFSVWSYILLHANFEDKEVIWNNEKRLIKKGSYIGSLRKIADFFHISTATVKYIVDYLVLEHMIEHLPTRKFSLFTVLNWDLYQSVEHQVVNKVSSKLAQVETTNKYNNYNKENKNTGDVPSQEIILIIDSFKEVNPSYRKWYGNITQRKAIERLLLIHGKDRLLSVVSFLPRSNTIPYVPIITSPYILEEKWADLQAGLIKLKNKENLNKPQVIFS